MVSLSQNSPFFPTHHMPLISAHLPTQVYSVCAKFGAIISWQSSASLNIKHRKWGNDGSISEIDHINIFQSVQLSDAETMPSGWE